VRVLILGAYGNFGARICRALARDASFELLVCGRSPDRAREFAATLPGAEGVVLDHTAPNFALSLAQLRPDVLIHTAGPYQEQSYAVALAAARAGAHYIDLADGRRFVCDFPAALRAPFRAAERVAVSGASTVPALSTAVLDRLCAGWQQVHTIGICIAPAQTAPRGVATLKGVLSYCGEPVTVWRDGRWQSTIGWASPKPVHIRGLKPRVGAVCDAPDLELLPKRYAVRDRVELLAALEVVFTQRGFAALAALRRVRLIPSVARFAGPLSRWGAWFDRFGSQLGGMAVDATGIDAAGKPVSASWHLTANEGHGPEIPSMAAVLLTHALKNGTGPTPGAYACAGLIPLVDFEAAFARWSITTDVFVSNSLSPDRTPPS
jgi:hypothetical protein